MHKKIIEIHDDYRPREIEEYMCNRQLEYFRRKLLAWKHDLQTESNEALKYLKEENWNEADLSDRATVEEEVRIELRTQDRFRKLMDKIDAALMRINKNEYGFCEDTGEPIGIRRLEARPIATLCIEAQEKHERFERNHNDDI